MRARTLRFKLGLWSAAVSGLVVLVFAVGTAIAFYFEWREALDVVLEDAGASVIAEYERGVDPASDSQSFTMERVFLDEMIEIHLFQVRNTDLGVDIRNPMWTISQIAASDESEETLTVAIDGVDYGVGVVEENGWEVVTGAHFELLHEEIFDVVVEYLLVIPWAMIAAGLGGWWIGRLALRPIEVIIENAEAVTAAGSGEEIPETSSHEELRRLTKVINETIERLKNAYAQASRFSADASHQLKTPLTIIQGELDAALKSPDATEDANVHVSRSLEQVQRLKQITDSLLILSRSDAGKLQLDRSRIDLSAELNEMLEDCRVLGEPRQLQFEAAIADGVRVEGDASLIRQAIFNVLANAVKFSAKGSTVRCALKVEGGAAELTVGNTGVEIKSEYRERIFERFFKGHPGENGNYEGLGLGLSLSNEILKAHGGGIELATGDEKHTEFLIRIPLDS